MNNPNYVKANGKKYKINTDFRTAIKCNEVSQDSSITDYERSLAIIYLLFGEEALNDEENYEKLTELAIKYLSFGEDISNLEKSEPDMAYNQDMWLIEASFRSDYGIDLKRENMHYWDFFKYLNGLTNECILNRVREIRNYDISKIKDSKDKEEIIKAKQRWKLKKATKKFSNEQIKNMEEFYQLLDRKE